jgi:predicted transcriptional regulator
MTADIHEIADHRPHLMVVASDGTHVIPHALVRSVIAGDKPSIILTEPVLRRIIEEWLQKVTA